MKNDSLVICFGKGGHEEQAKRLLIKLRNEPNFSNKSLTIISCSDSSVSLKVISNEHHYIGESRDKYSFFKSIVNLIGHIFWTFKFVFKILNYSDIKVFISTGPGLAILPGLLFKLLGVKIVYIESWSKFTTKSLTGKVMYLFADVFIVQNIELLDLYPNATYGGRL